MNFKALKVRSGFDFSTKKWRRVPRVPVPLQWSGLERSGWESRVVPVQSPRSVEEQATCPVPRPGPNGQGKGIPTPLVLVFSLTRSPWIGRRPLERPKRSPAD